MSKRFSKKSKVGLIVKSLLPPHNSAITFRRLDTGKFNHWSFGLTETSSSSYGINCRKAPGNYAIGLPKSTEQELILRDIFYMKSSTERVVIFADTDKDIIYMNNSPELEEGMKQLELKFHYLDEAGKIF